MFVAAGATERIRQRRRNDFAAEYVAPLVDERTVPDTRGGQLLQDRAAQSARTHDEHVRAVKRNLDARPVDRQESGYSENVFRIESILRYFRENVASVTEVAIN